MKIATHTNGRFYIPKEGVEPLDGYTLRDIEDLAQLQASAKAAGETLVWDEKTRSLIGQVAVARVPRQISAWQAKAALALTPHEFGGTLLDVVTAALNAMPEGAEKTVIMTAWENNANFARNSPTIATIAASLSLTSEELDNLFRRGAALTV